MLAFHAGYLTGGYLGVDLFFVISGYLITSLLVLESGATGTVSFGGFWARAARRLLPALLAVLVASDRRRTGRATVREPAARRRRGHIGLRRELALDPARQRYWQQTLRRRGSSTPGASPSRSSSTVWPFVVAATWGFWRNRRNPVASLEQDVRWGVRRLAIVAGAGAIGSAGGS